MIVIHKTEWNIDQKVKIYLFDLFPLKPRWFNFYLVRVNPQGLRSSLI